MEIQIPLLHVELSGMLEIPDRAKGLVLFAHGSGSSRFSPRNNQVAAKLREEGLGTLLFDLLTEEEDRYRENRFDIELLTRRLLAATEWTMENEASKDLSKGYFGASTGAASALKAAAELGDAIRAVVSRGGRPDLAADVLPQVTAPTLLIVGGRDTEVIRLNEQAYQLLNAGKSLQIVEGATHLFEEPGKLDEVADLATRWFLKYL
jgi:putative phosphoribosyl transferase